MIVHIVATVFAVLITLGSFLGIAMLIISDISDREWERALRDHMHEIEERGD